MPTLAELLMARRPIVGPALSPFPKAQSNATAGSIPTSPQPQQPKLSSDAEMLAALNAIASSQYENKLREAQAEKARAEAEEYRAAGKDTMPAGFGQRTGPVEAPASTPAPPSSAAWGALGGTAETPIASGPTSFSPTPDKSNFESGLRRLTDLGVNPDVAAGAVTYMDKNENGFNSLAVNPTSGALGRAQWLGPRKTALVSQHGARPSDEQQADFMGSELLGPERRTLNALLSAKTAKEGYDIWGTHYERPGAEALAKAGVGGALRGKPTNQIERQWADAGSPLSYASVPGGSALPGPDQFSPEGGMGWGGVAVQRGNISLPPNNTNYAGEAGPGFVPVGARGRFAGTPGLNGAQTSTTPLDDSQMPPPRGRVNNISPLGAPMSLAPQMPAAPQSQSRFSPEDMAWAQRQDRRNAILGKRNPASVDQALEMGPGGKGSLDYLGAAAGAKRGGEYLYDAATARFKADLDARNATWQSKLNRDAADAAAGRATGPGGDVVPRTGFAETEAGTQGAIEGAKAAAKSPIEMQRDLFQAQLARGSEQLKQNRAAELDPAQIRIGDLEISGTREQAARYARGEAVPELGIVARNATPAAGPLGRNVPAEELRTSQTKARVAIDTKAAEEAGTQATLSRRLMPLVDEVVRHADTTPEGWAGPLAASAARGLSAIGMTVPAGMSNAELLESVSRQLIPLVREPGATSEKELENYLKAVPGLMQSSDGRKKIAGMMKSMMERSIEIGAVYRDNVGAPDLREKLSKLDKPIFTDDQRASMGADAQEGAIAESPGKPDLIMRGGKWVPVQ